MNNWKALLGPMRLPFVTLAPCCVLLGLGTAYWQTGGHIDWLYFVLAMVGGVAAHISVNSFNEYFDFKTGLDAKTRRTPFSGGSGTLQAHPELHRSALAIAWISFAVTALVGVFFVFIWGWQVIPFGIVGLFLLYSYTIWLAYNPILCLIAPGLGFGMMTLGTHFALTGNFSLVALLASLVPFFLVSDLLLLNQFPDVEADRTIGRRHFPITIGRTLSGYIYIGFLLAAYVVIAFAVLFGFLPKFALLGLLTLVIAVQVIRGVLANSENAPALVPSMGQNVLINLLTPVLVAVGLFIR